jgi:glycosyltransferase involved in cell wall biosynthesis
MADVVFAPSSGTAALMRSLNVPEEKIQLMPYVVDNHWWVERARIADRRAVRSKWNVPENANIVLFCAKLQPWKRPADVLRAFHRADIPNSYLVFVGEGPLRNELEREAERLGISNKVRFLGFVNQSALPEVYVSSDVMVLPSEYEPFGLVVNEAMLCGCGVIVSDCVGARFDLVKDRETGRVYPCGNISSLSQCLQEALSAPASLSVQRQAARDHIAKWCPALYVQKFVHAVIKAQGSHNRILRKRTQQA